jgi:hypothetical protein
MLWSFSRNFKQVSISQYPRHNAIEEITNKVFWVPEIKFNNKVKKMLASLPPPIKTITSQFSYSPLSTVSVSQSGFELTSC